MTGDDDDEMIECRDVLLYGFGVLLIPFCYFT